jgi:hypothetical protein
MGNSSPRYGRLGHLLVATVLILTFVTSCRESHMNTTPDPRVVAAFEQLQQVRVFFGHRSVGRNILDGIEDLAEATGVSIEIREADDAAVARDSAHTILHAGIGENGRPQTKVDHFARLMRSGLAEQVDVAFMKFCYVDSEGDMSAKQVFESYVGEMEELEGEFPDTVFLYVTMPLKAPRTDIKGRIKMFLGMESRGRGDNIPRHRFNQLLREAKSDTGRLFDLARAEATAPDGPHESFRQDGKVYEAMYPGYTSDGGHLNEYGRRVVAAELVNFLSGFGGSE